MGDDERIFQERDGIRILPMANKNSIWFRKDTEENCRTILKYLIDDKKEMGRARKVTFSQLSKYTNILPSSVSSACYILAFLRKPRLRMWAEKTPAPGGSVFTRMRIRLL